METPLAVANYFIKKSLQEGVATTPMKLVKLVYVAHGWYLGLTGEPLIGASVEAWKYGPVVSDVYHAFKGFKDQAINAQYFDAAGQYYPIVKNKTEPFLDKIWETYKGYSGIELSAMTHMSNTPWDITWNHNGGNVTQGAIIPNGLIEEYYKRKAATNQNESEH